MVAQYLCEPLCILRRKLIVVANHQPPARKHQRTKQLRSQCLCRFFDDDPIELFPSLDQAFHIRRIGGRHDDVRGVEHEVGNGAEAGSQFSIDTVSGDVQPLCGIIQCNYAGFDRRGCVLRQRAARKPPYEIRSGTMDFLIARGTLLRRCGAHKEHVFYSRLGKCFLDFRLEVVECIVPLGGHQHTC